MPVDASIPLSLKPFVVPDAKLPETFLTLSQMRYLAANTQAAQEEAARKQRTFEELPGAQAALLGSLRTRTAPAPAMQPPAAPQPGTVSSTPPVVTGPTLPDQAPTAAPSPPEGEGAPAPKPNIFDQATQAAIRQAAPHIADDFINTAQKTAISQLEGQQKVFENSIRSMVHVSDEASYQAWLLMTRSIVDPAIAARLPAHYETGTFAKMKENGQSLLDTFGQHIAAAKSVNETTTAKAAETTAATGARRLTYPVGPTGIVPQPESQPPGVPMPTAGPNSIPIPGTAPVMAPGAAEAAGYEQRAIAAHNIMVELENKGLQQQSGVGKAITNIQAFGIGNAIMREDVQRYNQAKSDFITALSRGESPRLSADQLNRYDRQYAWTPGDGTSQAAGSLTRQKQIAREAGINELRIQTNRPLGLAPPGTTSMPGTGIAPPIQLQPGQKPPTGAIPLTEATIQHMLRKRPDLTREQILRTLGGTP